MSGGHLTDYQHDLHRLNDWAEIIDKVNPLLALQMRDMCELLDRYDRYLSGDIGEDAIGKAWSEYRDKWIEMDTASIEDVMFEKCLETLHEMINGYRKDEK